MSIYNINGNQINSAYDRSQSVQVAYDINGNIVFQSITSLKVMSYNVGGWYIGSGENVPTAKKDLYYALQTGMIEDNDPDILIIQEYLANFSADGTSALTMLQSLFPYVHTKTSGTYYGRAICSKYPITNYTERQFTQETSRYFDSCTITVNNIPITVVNTHLGLTQANRTPEITQLIAYLNTLDTFVLGGDFNTGIVESSASTSSESYINNVKPFVDEGFNTANFGDFGFMVTCVDRTNNTPYYLDNIYTSSDISITDAYVDTTKLTDLIDDPIDHMPIIAELTL